MKILHFLTIFLLFPVSLCANDVTPSIGSMLEALDQVLDSAEYYKQAKEQRIKQIRSKIDQQPDSEQLHILNTMLFSEYAKYDSRAAFELAIKCAEVNREVGDMSRYAMWRINRAYLYTASGLLKESFDILDSTRLLIKSRSLLLEYYRQMEYLLSHSGQYSTGNERLSPQYYRLKEVYIDSIAQIIKPRDRNYLVNKGWQHQASDSTVYYRELLERRFLSSMQDTQDDAMDAYTIAHMYNSEEDNEHFMEYLIEAAKADIKSFNHDIASLQELAQLLLDEGDVERAYSYLSYSLEKAKSFGDRVRVMEIATLLDSIYGELLARNREQSRVLMIFLILVVLLFVIVVVLLINLRRKHERLRVTLSSLDEANVKLDLHITQLEQTHAELNRAYAEQQQLNASLLESNYIKESYIGSTFEVCSIHIGKMEKIFVKIASLARHDKFDELRRYCDSSLLVNAELKLLYQAFDYTFLKMYPNFVERFNELLSEDKRIKLRADESLNTELRIYALYRLGISDNQQIASILHCSLQTVYNNFQKTKNRTELTLKELLSGIMRIQ